MSDNNKRKRGGQIKHGHAISKNGKTVVTSEYQTWRNIKRRCLNPKDRDYALYGGRGIMVCERWRDSFEMFLADVGPKPSSKHSIDRIDNERGYEPGNVRWATPSEQGANRRTTKLTSDDVAEIRSLRASGKATREIGAIYGVSANHVRNIVSGFTRASDGWPAVKP